jgi:hypothetical protein
MADLKNFLERLGDKGAQSFLNRIESLGVPLDDRRLEDFLKEIDLIDTLADRQRADLEQALEAALNRDSLEVDYDRIASIVRSQIGATGKTSTQQLPAVNWLFAMAGMAVGIAITGFSTYTYFLPRSVDAARLQDATGIKYLQSSEGRLFREIVRLNSGYLDTDRCRIDAAKKKLFLTRGIERITSVCALVVPDRS